ncbi:MAG: site-specific DNA-methyltransferase [Akkermansia sp.]
MMDSIPMKSRNRVAENISIIKQFFPQCVLETMNAAGEMMLKVDMDSLLQEFSDHVLQGREQRYLFTWPQKRESIHLTNLPITKTLRPCKEESVDFDKTKNLYIEGDNLDVLKLLQETYLSKVKMIYIDPPYNTGNDFVYEDDYSITAAEWKGSSNEYDEDGNRLFKNTSANGRFHTDWLNMMYPRLRLAKDLLRDDGVIFISIDDNEVHNLRKICDEIFGERNFIGTILWKKKTNGNNVGLIPPVHDYIIVYTKEILNVEKLGYSLAKEEIDKVYSNPDNDPRGPWKTMDLSANHVGPTFPITNKLTGEVFTPSVGRYWVFNQNEVERRIQDGRIIFGKSGKARPVQKVFASERINNKRPAESWWDKHGMNGDATAEIMSLFGHGKLFTHPKPTKLILNLLRISTNSDDIIVDFFSGSASTAHAVMQLNAEDGGNRRFILVQLPEQTDEKSEAYKAGYSNICEIGKERIRRAAAKIKEENPLTTQNSDLGFRVLKLDESNMAEVFYNPNEVHQNLFENMLSNVKADRTGHDLLFQVMLSLGIDLSMPILEEVLEGKTVYTVGSDYALIACFDAGLSQELLSELAQRKPYHFVTRDAALANDSLSTNVEHIFKCLSHNTHLHVL